MTMTAIHVTSRLQCYSVSNSCRAVTTRYLCHEYNTDYSSSRLLQYSVTTAIKVTNLHCYSLCISRNAVFCDNSHPCHDYSITHHPTPALCCNDWPAIHVTSTLLFCIQFIQWMLWRQPSMSREQFCIQLLQCNLLWRLDSHPCHENSYCDDMTAREQFYIQHPQCSPATVMTWQRTVLHSTPAM